MTLVARRTLAAGHPRVVDPKKGNPALPTDVDPSVNRARWRLYPSERVLWSGRAEPGVPPDRWWRMGAALAAGLALVAGLFGGLVFVAGLPGARELFTVVGYMALFATGLALFPRLVLAGGEYVITDRRVLWARGRLRRSMDRHAVTYGRIQWHRSAAGIGSLELVRDVPFGPLARKQRLVLSDIAAPDAVYAIVRGVTPSPHAGDPDVPLMDRLDPEERVIWGGRPEGWLLGWQEVATATGGALVTAVGLLHGHRLAQIIIGLEEDAVVTAGSWEWILLFGASAISWAITITVGAGLLWYGLGRARRLGRETDYLVTDRRVLIRRGRTELSVDRWRIVDVADQPGPRGLSHLFLVLDAPGSRALAVSGALGPLLPARDGVPPVFFELRDSDQVRRLILRHGGEAAAPQWSKAT